MLKAQKTMGDDADYRESHKTEGKGAAYDQMYETNPWERFLWTREQRILCRILDEHFRGRDIHLLDFACGTGRLTSFLEDRVSSAVGVDVSSSMLEMAQKKLKRTELVQADLTRENVFQGRKFNLITAFRFFLNAESALRTSAMRAIVPLLADDGCLVFNNHRNPSTPYNRLANVWYGNRRRRNVNFMTVQEMKNVAHAGGLEVIDIFPVGFSHVPKVTLPDSWNHMFETIARKIRWPAAWAECLIAVCRHSTKA